MNILSLLIPKNESAYIFDTCTLRQGLEKMKAHGYTAIPVLTKDGMYAGTVSEGDFLWNILDRFDNSMKSKEKLLISDIIRKDFNPSVNVYISMDELLQCAVNQSFIPVTDDRGYFIGIVTRQKIILTLLQNSENKKVQ
ncbi:MAG: CBS domain-containing protein [Oscillospiraceae bacterium]